MTGQDADAEREKINSASQNDLCQDSEEAAKDKPEIPDNQQQAIADAEKQKDKTAALAAQTKRRTALINTLLVAILCCGLVWLGFIQRPVETKVTDTPVQTDKRLAELNQSIEHEPNNAQLYLERARIFYFDREEAVNAYTDLSRAIQLAPDLVDAYLLRSDVGGFLHRYAESQADIDKATALAPNTASIYVQRAHLDGILEDYNKEKADAEKAFTLEAQNFLAWGELGSAYQGLGRYADAARCITRQLELHQKPEPYPLNFVARGIARFLMRDFDGSIQDENSAMKIKPNLGIALIIRSYAEAAKGDVALAEADADKGLREETVPSRGHRLVGDLYRYLGKHERAIEEYGKAISQYSIAVISYRGRGISYYRLGQLKNALEDLQHAAKVNPSSTTLSYLALVEDDLGDKAGADRDISLAFSHSTPTSFTYSNSAAIKFKRGNMAEALIDAKKALAMDEYNADAYQLLGQILKAGGRYKEAQENFDKAKLYGYPNSSPPPAW